ncbi:unnamed protein product [Callosobruchus maculatus]|uniref:Uncharacterized protein n=1 Tax=Callosobruchus maculatus TaxID=64391 RepID=A0A653CBP8_CALMS|nr:unnamed protein product [Callosobruchus maculatus]
MTVVGRRWKFLGEPRIWPVFFKVKGYLANLFPIVRFGFTSREGIQDHEFWALATHLHLRGTLHQGTTNTYVLFLCRPLYIVSSSYRLILSSYYLPSIYIWHAHRSSYVFSVKNI